MNGKAPNRIAIALYSEFLRRCLIPSIQMGYIMDHGKSRALAASITSTAIIIIIVT